MAFEPGRSAHSKLDRTVKTERRTCYKVVRSGKFVEIYKSTIPFKTGKTLVPIEPIFQAPPKIKERFSEYQKRSSYRAKNKVKRIIQANFNHQAKFITLTFRDTYEFDIGSLEVCYTKLKSFLYKMRRIYGEFQYLVVPEYQKRGAVHYHIVANLPFVENELLAEIWGQGFVKINLVTNHKKIGVYLTKYLTKETFTRDTKGLKRYYRSSNLKDATVMYGENAEYFAEFILTRFSDNIIYNNSYESKYNGNIDYYELCFINNEKGKSL